MNDLDLLENADGCLFCGSHNAYITLDEMRNDFFVRCSVCHAQGPSSETKKNAIYYWNEHTAFPPEGLGEK